MPEKQAEILAEEQVNLIENNLATKRDLKDLEVALRRDIECLREQLTHDLTIRLGTMMVIGIGVVSSLVVLF